MRSRFPFMARTLGGLAMLLVPRSAPAESGFCFPVQADKIAAPDGAAGDLFGSAVDIDGDLVIIGATGDDDAGNRSGSAYVFVLVGGSLVFEDKLVDPNGAALNEFGYSVAISGDRAIVGSPFSNSAAGARSGHVDVFLRGRSVWTHHRRITLTTPVEQNFFGFSVALDGNRALIGVPLADCPMRGDGDFDCGCGHFEGEVCKTCGDIRPEQDERNFPLDLYAPDGQDGAHYGFDVDLKGDRAIVGARDDDNAGGVDAGAAYLYIVPPAGSPVFEVKLIAADGAPGDGFGAAVAVDGDTAVVGAPFADSGRGAAYFYTRAGDFVWSLNARIVPDGAMPGDNFGASVAIDGGRAVIGAPFADNGSSGIGKVYLASPSGGVWETAHYITAADAAAGDEHGNAVAIHGTTMIVSSWRDDDAGSASGSVYAYLAPTCPGDTNGDGIVNFADVTGVLTNFGFSYLPQPGTGPGDADCSGEVNFTDVTGVLTNFGVQCE